MRIAQYLGSGEETALRTLDENPSRASDPFHHILPLILKRFEKAVLMMAMHGVRCLRLNLGHARLK